MRTKPTERYEAVLCGRGRNQPDTVLVGVAGRTFGKAFRRLAGVALPPCAFVKYVVKAYESNALVFVAFGDTKTDAIDAAKAMDKKSRTGGGR